MTQAKPKADNFSMKAVRRTSSFLGRLRRNQSGLALTEFALSIPIFTGLGMYGTETAYRAVAQMQDLLSGKVDGLTVTAHVPNSQQPHTS